MSVCSMHMTFDILIQELKIIYSNLDVGSLNYTSHSESPLH